MNKTIKKDKTGFRVVKGCKQGKCGKGCKCQDKQKRTRQGMKSNSKE